MEFQLFGRMEREGAGGGGAKKREKVRNESLTATASCRIINRYDVPEAVFLGRKVNRRAGALGSATWETGANPVQSPLL